MSSKELESTSKDEIKGQSGSDEKKDFSKSKSGNKKWGKSKRHSRNGNRRVNDPNWYVANPQIVKDVANLPFAVYNGINYSLFNNQTVFKLPGNSAGDTHVPGVMIYKYVPWYGNSTPTSSLNLTMRALYSYVRHVNSGKTNYEAPDLMLYIMAMDSVYLLIHEIKRLIRLAYHYNLENRDIPEKIFKSLGINHTDLISNLANYRAALNTRIAKANSLAVPNNFNLFKRRAVFGSVVLTDEPNRPTQLIIPKADGVYQFSAKTNVTGGSLQWMSLTKTGQYRQEVANNTDKRNAMSLTTSYWLLSDYIAKLDNLLSVLLSDEDINIMSGDIIKAYGDNLFRLPFIAENEIQEITHDEDLLLQFSNSTVLDMEGATLANLGTRKYSRVFFANVDTSGNIVYSNTPVIAQTAGSLLSQAVFNMNSKTPINSGETCTVLNAAPLAMLDNIFISTSKANTISPENILEWTRLCMVMDEQAIVDNNYHVIEAGVEIGLGWLVHVPTTYFSVSPSGKYPTIVAQFFQFGTIDAPGFRRPLPNTIVNGPVAAATLSVEDNEVAPASGKVKASDSRAMQDPVEDNNSLLTYWVTDYTNGILKDKINYRNRNIWYVKQAMSGLTYGPNNYLTGGIDYNTWSQTIVYMDGSIEKLYEKTAIANKFNIKAMHDAALLGLISSPYVKNS